MIVVDGLVALGFEPLRDFVARDDGDGPYLLAWLSPQPQPSDADQAAAAATLLAADLVAYAMRRRDALIDGGFIFGGVDYQSRATDRENILGAALMASMAIAAGAQPGDYRWSDPDADFEWIALDNSRVAMDAHTVIALGQAQAARKQQLIFTARAIKDAIAAGTITTTTQIDAAFG